MKVDARFENPLLQTRDDLFSRCVRLLAESCVLSNRALLSEQRALGRPIPELYKSGVRYQNEPMGRPDELVDIPTILLRRWGDCLHLCCWRVAELREAGESKARIRIKRKRSGQRRIFHVQVRRANGTVEDPSKLLGM